MIKALWASALLVGFLVAPAVFHGGAKAGEATVTECSPFDDMDEGTTCLFSLRGEADDPVYTTRWPKRFDPALAKMFADRQGTWTIEETVQRMRALRDRLEAEEKGATATE